MTGFSTPQADAVQTADEEAVNVDHEKARAEFAVIRSPKASSSAVCISR